MEEILYKILKFANENAVKNQAQLISSILPKVGLEEYIGNEGDISKKLNALGYAHVLEISRHRYGITTVKIEGKLFLKEYESKFESNSGYSSVKQPKLTSRVKEDSSNRTIKVFISYSWDNAAYQKWVLDLAEKLIQNGVDVILDQYELSAGKNLTHFMEKSVNDSDKVLLLLTKNYKLRADRRTGGVGYEYSIINAELYAEQTSNVKFLPIQMDNDRDSCIPTFLKPFISLNFSNGDSFDTSFSDLLHVIFDEPKVRKPELGSIPDFKKKA